MAIAPYEVNDDFNLSSLTERIIIASFRGRAF